MSKSVAKTTGLEWLQHSITAFNGSGYADMSSAEAFLESYITYNRWKRRSEAVKLANQFYQSVLPLAAHIVETSEGAGIKPSEKNLAKFNAFKQREQLF